MEDRLSRIISSKRDQLTSSQAQADHIRKLHEAELLLAEQELDRLKDELRTVPELLKANGVQPLRLFKVRQGALGSYPREPFSFITNAWPIGRVATLTEDGQLLSYSNQQKASHKKPANPLRMDRFDAEQLTGLGDNEDYLLDTYGLTELSMNSSSLLTREEARVKSDSEDHLWVSYTRADDILYEPFYEYVGNVIAMLLSR